MTQNNEREAFEKWFIATQKILGYSPNAADAWQAATQSSESEINSLKQRVEELTTSNNQLREALELARKEYEGLPHSLGYEFTHLPIINKALSSTPKQSLAEHDNDVIESCAVVCESLKEQDYCVDVRAGAEAIRALKITP